MGKDTGHSSSQGVAPRAKSEEIEQSNYAFPCDSGALVSSSDPHVDQIIHQEQIKQDVLPEPSFSPKRMIDLLPVELAAEDTLSPEQKEKQRLVFLHNAIQLRRRHYARVGAEKIATYIRQCYAWGYPIDWSAWLKAIPPPRVEFPKRDPKTYQRPQNIVSALGLPIEDAGSTRSLFPDLNEELKMKIVNLLDYPAIQSLRQTAKTFDNVYDDKWEEICDNIYKEMRHKITHIPEFFTPAGSPEEDSEVKLRQYHYCIDWVVASILPDYHDAKAISDAALVQASNDIVFQSAFTSPSMNKKGQTGKGIPIPRRNARRKAVIVGNQGAAKYATSFGDKANAQKYGWDFGIGKDGSTLGRTSSEGSESGRLATAAGISQPARPNITEGETFPFSGLLKYVFEKFLGSSRRSKDNLPRYHRNLNTIERAVLGDSICERRAFHWAMNLVSWHLMKDRTVYYAIRNEFLEQIKRENEEDEVFEVEDEDELTISDREYVERLKWLKPVQLWELVRLVKLDAVDIIDLMKVKGFLEVDEECDEVELMEDFILARVKQVLGG
ncbi:hypothetical protein TWF481_004981 [Arthrobotrys musiformis]|uniref:F-box domain-containing protein n=1 Tax=Arthrobotrys musiformis TaxID=47236 RepID=A0AAV9WN57_9PEZI